jgi:hypothetical protein
VNSVRPFPTVSTRPATREQLLEAARLGASLAAADLAGSPVCARTAHASWRRLRRHHNGESRRVLRIAFDTGYGRGFHTAAHSSRP